MGETTSKSFKKILIIRVGWEKKKSWLEVDGVLFYYTIEINQKNR